MGLMMPLGKEPMKSKEDDMGDSMKEERKEGASGIDAAAEEFRSAVKRGSGRELADALQNLLAAADEEEAELRQRAARSDRWHHLSYVQTS